LEPIGLTPHVKKHIAQQVFGDRLIADEAQKPAIDVGAIPVEKGLHREAITSGNPRDQHLIG
jgi:hypothetical protein